VLLVLGLRKVLWISYVYEIGEGFTGGVAKSQQEFNIRNQEHFKELSSKGGIEWRQKFDNDQWKGGKNQFRNLLALPLKIKGEVLGVIKAENKKIEFGQHFSEEDMQIFRTIANVIALAIENLKLYQETQKQLKSISSRAAHRINNQVANYDYIELKLERLANKLSPQHKEELLGLSKKVFTYTTNLKRMITEFKDFGKPLQLKKDETDINAVIRSEADQHNEKYKVGGITVSTELDNNIKPFSFDGARFAESIKEMLENAKRAFESSKQSGNIKISTRLVEIDNKQIVIVRIQDDGPGIPKNTQLFVPFQSTDAQRTGLGLTTVKELMKAHGGDIVHIPTDKGTAFEITLPVA
jgi:signal transduction histidine kinase